METRRSGKTENVKGNERSRARLDRGNRVAESRLWERIKQIPPVGRNNFYFLFSLFAHLLRQIITLQSRADVHATFALRQTRDTMRKRLAHVIDYVAFTNFHDLVHNPEFLVDLPAASRKTDVEVVLSPTRPLLFFTLSVSISS